MTTTGTCSNCGREADDLQRCTGACGGDAMYCNQHCQKSDWSMHKKICPRGKSSAQPLTFVLPPPGFPPNPNIPGMENLPEIPVRAVRRMDGIGGSGLMLMYSDHLGYKKLIPFARAFYSCDTREEAIETAKYLPNEAYCCVTSPVEPETMKLKPEEACFNTEKYPSVVKALLSSGIITDTGKRVQLGYYPEMPICRIHALQTDNREAVMEQREHFQNVLAKIGVTPKMVWLR